jgi:hypothetical protein
MSHLATLLACSVLLGSATASAAAPLNIAVGLERPQELGLVESPADHSATRALAQGVREACLTPSGQLRTLAQACKTVGDVPDSGVCVEETVEQALTRQIDCAPGDLVAGAVDLSRSGCSATDCYALEARKAGASHLFIVSAAWSDSGLALAGQFIDLRDGSTRAVAPTNFATRYSAVWTRTQPQVLGLLKWFARAQTGAALHELQSVERAVGQGSGEVKAVETPSAAKPLPSAMVTTTAAAGEQGRASKSWVGWTLIGAGVGAAVGSAISWRRNGDLAGCGGPEGGDSDPCRREQHTIVPTIGLGVAAVGAIVVGTVVLIREHRRDDRLTLFLHSNGVALGGNF